VLEEDPADFPKFNASTVMSFNELYGAGQALAFVETLRAEGKNVTRGGFVKALTSTTLDTPAITPLRYTNGNHQGMQGGAIATVNSNGSLAPNSVTVTKTVFTTTPFAGSPLNSSNWTIAPIPSWLK
jgi:hypothetical protein